MKYIYSLICLLVMNVSFSQEINKMDANGKRHGAWKGYYEDSKILRYEGTFNKGVEVGTFTYYANADKKIVSATRKFDGKGNAYTTFFDDKGFKVSEGNMLNKKRQGLWTYYHKGLKVVMCIENYVNDKLEGVRKVFFADNVLAEEVTYKNGLKSGISKIYSKAGTLKEESVFVNGLMHGSYKVYDDNGTVLIEGQYKDDKKKGIWKYYNGNKELVGQVNTDTINGHKKPSLFKKK